MNFSQLMRVMKITMVLITCFLLQVSAATYGQRVTINRQRASLADVLEEISETTGYDFFYDAEIFDGVSKVTVNVKDADINKVLSLCFYNLPFDYTINNKIVTIKKISRTRLVPAVFRQQPGRITGKVLDDYRGEPLPGASVKIIQTNYAIQSKVDGTYTLKVGSGTYTLEVSFIGYQTKRITGVVVKEGQTTSLNVGLSLAANALQQVTVTGSYKKESVAFMLVAQKNNAAITDGISAEQIARNPDQDAGLVLRRITGISTVDNKYVVVRGLSERYNQALINGQIMPSTEINRKNFSFDVVPANIVENITVQKTLTPDQSAEFGGAAVELKTMSVPAENFANISIGSTYNTETTGKQFATLPLDGKEYWGSVSAQRRFLGSLNWNSGNAMREAWTARGGAIQRDDGQIVMNPNGAPNPPLLANNWGITSFIAPVSPNLSASIGRALGNTETGRWGIVAGVSYRNTLQTRKVKIGGRDGFMEQNKDLASFSGFSGTQYDFTTGLAGLLGVGFKNMRHEIGLQSLYMRSLNQSFALGSGDGFLGPNTMGYYDKANQSLIIQQQLKGEHLLDNKGIKLNWNASYTRADVQRPDNHQMLLGAWTRPDEDDPTNINYSFGGSFLGSGLARFWARANENNFAWNTALTIPKNLKLGNVRLDNKLKVGYGGWSKDRYFYVLNTGTSHNNISYPLPIAEVFTQENGVDSYISKFQDFFKSPNAILHNGYVMLDNKISQRWRLVWGVRAEYYNINRVNQNLDILKTGATKYDTRLIENNEPNLRWFPSANLTYSLTKDMNLRLAYSKSIIRPDLRELSYMKEYDFELGGDYYGSRVQSTKIQNFDFRYEWYTGKDNMVTATLFYKKLDYPMEIVETQSRTFMLRNSKYAKNYGAEVEFRQSLRAIDVSVLRNITLSGNFALLDSRVMGILQDSGYVEKGDPTNLLRIKEILYSSESKRPQVGASKYLANAAAYYDSKFVSAALSLNYTDVRSYVIQESADPNIRPAVYETPPLSLDGQFSFRLLRQKMSFTLNAINLLGKPFVRYMKGEAKRYQNGDPVRFYGNSGRTYGLNINYKF